jgi:peptidoglycan hydrolase-like protein with peptidoglycan-binding domain
MLAAPPSPSPPPAPAVQVAGKLTLTVQHAHGSPPFALTGESVVVRGVVIPFAAKQKVTVRFTLDGRRTSVHTVSVLPVGNGAGQFHLAYSSSQAGLVGVSAAHAPSPRLAAFRARPVQVRFAAADMTLGARGPGVWLLQSRLSALHYAVPRSGVFDEGTGQAVIAYRKLTGLALVPSTDAQVFHLLQRGAGAFHVRYPRDGRHVEADLARQVLAEIEPGGRVREIYTISSGKPSTPTVLGRFQVYMKTPGVNAKGMVDSNYFIRGYAIHGYPEVPTYAASHGCLRVPIPDAPAIYAWVQIGTPVDVYG